MCYRILREEAVLDLLQPQGVLEPNSTAAVPTELRNPTTISVQGIDMKDLAEWQVGDPLFPGTSGRDFDLALERGAKAVIVSERMTSTGL